MRTTLRLLAISSLGLTSIVLMLGAVAEARTRPHYGGLVRIESSADADAAGLVTETLTSVDASGRIEPLLAEHWEAQNGGRRWQFWLRPNVRFHDGSLLSSTDVAQALSSKPGVPWRSTQANGSTVIFETDQPQPALPALVSLPQYAISKTDGSGSLIGTGPFRVNGVAGNVTKLAAFDDYWQGRPYVDAIELNGGRGVRDQWMDLGVARADIVEVPAEQIRRAQQERLRVLVSRNIELVALVASANSSQDVLVRQAISAAIDRTSMLNVIFQKQGEVAAGVLPDWMTGYDFLFSAAQNLALARDLRGQAEQTGTITIGYAAGDGIQQLLAERAVLNARDAGIVMQAVPHNGNGQADLTVVRLALVSRNVGAALRQIASTIVPGDTGTVDSDPEALYRKERDLLSSYRVIPLLYVPRGSAASQRIRNWALDGIGAPAVTQIWTEDRR
jgi:peptide/nickel transport system substrate-binding protein